MALAVLVAVDDDPHVLEEVETQLVQRYGRDYRVECLRGPDEALRKLTELRDAAADVALVLAGQSFAGTSCGELFEQVRQLHPHAKRALLVEANAWTYEPTAQAIRSSMALGRIDHYVLRPVAPQDEALRKLTELRDAAADVALVLAGQSFSGMGCGELFEQVRQLHPHAKRALLVEANAWTYEPTAQAIRSSMALGRIDHYVLRPVAPQDEVFHEAVSDFLLEWALDCCRVPQTVHIVGEAWSGRAYELREVFARCVVPHAFYLADSDEGREFVASAGPDAKLPLMVLPDGSVLSDPSNAEIAEAAGAPRALQEQAFEVVIVGSGPAGLSAAVYGASEGLRVLVVDAGGIGGQARSSPLIRNYLGFGKGVSGSRLAAEAHEQAASLGASFLFMHRVTALTRSDGWLHVSLSDGRRIGASAVILATGASYRRLGIASLEALNGAGVFYGGPSFEAPWLSGKNVYVVGGGNSAGQAALHLARFAGRVTVVVRAQTLEAGMSHYLIQAVEAAPNVTVRTDTAVVGGGGEGHLQQLVLRDAAGEDTTVAADALFVLIGARPQTEWLPADIARDEYGFLVTGEDVTAEDWPLERRPLSLETSMPCVFAAGDVRHASIKRLAAAAGEGSIAIQLVQRLVADGQLHPPPGTDVAMLRESTVPR